MKHYMDYLIENNVINQDQYLEALLFQVSHSPSLAEVVYENGALSLEDQLRVFQELHDKGTTYAQAVKSLGLWDDKFANNVERYSLNFCPSAYKALVELGHVDLKNLVRNVDEYIAILSEDPDKLEKVKYQVLTLKNVPPPTEVPLEEDKEQEKNADTEVKEEALNKSQPDQNFDFKLKTFNQVLVKEFLSLMNKDFKIQVMKYIENLSESQDQAQIKSNLESLNMEMSNVESGTQFMGLEVAGALSRNVCVFNSRMLEKDAISDMEKDLIISINRRTVDELFFLKVYFELTLSEKSYWNLEERQQSFKTIINEAS